MTAREDLERALGVQVPVLEKLTDAEIAEIFQLFAVARKEEAAALVKSIDETLAALPWPVRVPAKKIMFGNLK